MSQKELVKLPDGLVTAVIYGKGGRNIKDLTARLREHCKITGKVCLTQVMDVAVCVQAHTHTHTHTHILTHM